jgi:ribosomal-protein-alanine N-acetyltransferase
MELVKATINDIDSILELHNSLFKFKYSYDNYANEIDLDIAEFMILKDNRIIIGYFIIHYLFEQLDIVIIGVAKEYQGYGYGKKLLDYIESLMIENKCDEIVIEVNELNHQAIAFYKRNNFEKIGYRKNYYGNNENALVYARRWMNDKR